MGKILIRTVAALLGLWTLPSGLSAQMTVKSNVPAESVVNDYLVGEGLKVRNVKYTGDARALGVFELPGGRPGFEKGILISTGKAADAAGPNNDPKTSTALGQAGDKDLYELAKGRTFDAAILEFEFMAARDSVSLEFMFASEEYNDYVGSTFSDAFMIRISGPGFPGGRELAVIPGTQTPINVNTVNYNTNGQYYEDNNPFTLAGRLNEKRKAELDQEVLSNLEYDGMTKVLSVGTEVKPREVYRIRIAIADAGDGQMDSGLFIRGGSFQSIEQYRWVLRRQQIAEKRRLDSLARVAFVEDSLVREQAIADSLAALEAEEAESEWDIPDDTYGGANGHSPDDAHSPDNGHSPDDAHSPDNGHSPDDGHSPKNSDSPDNDETERAEAADDLPDEVADLAFSQGDDEEDDTESMAVTRNYHRPPGPGDRQDYRAVIRYARDDFLVPDASRDLVKRISAFMIDNPDLRVGIYAPGGDQNSTLRFDMVKAELLRYGLSPDRIFQNGFSFLNAGEAGGIHRVEIWVRRAE